MKIYSALFVGLMTFLAAACTGDKGGKVAVEAAPVPAESRLEAFCRGINYRDTAAMHDEKAMKKTVAEVVKMLPASGNEAVRAGMGVFFDSLRHDEAAMVMATGYLGDFLGKPNSPVRNEEMYIGILSLLLENDSLPAVVRETAAEKLRIASLNRKGTIASDFCFEEPDGSRHTMHGIEAPMTLIVFYDPECPHCKDILDNVAMNQTVNKGVSEGTLSVIAVYTEGKRDVWRKALDSMPRNWRVGFDCSEIVNKDIYDIPAMPTLYLLDRDKRVLLKDPNHRILGAELRKRGL